MKRHRLIGLGSLVLLVWSALLLDARRITAQSYQQVESFRAPSPNLYSPVIQGTDGNLYGTTYQGGNGYGAVFKLSRDGRTFATVHGFAFSEGAYPYAGVVQGSDGNLYGTTTQGGGNGYGTVFKLSLDGKTFTTLHTFAPSDGGSPYGGLVQADDGNLYGTTTQGGAGGYGTVFMVSPGGAFATLYSFSFSDGAVPYAALIQGADGNLYGTTSQGGSGSWGTAFGISTDGSSFTTIHNFAFSDGANPYGSLVQGVDGNLYGTTSQGGSGQHGTVFAVSPDGSSFTTVYGLTSSGGEFPYAGLLQTPDGSLYGTTTVGGDNDYGTVFEVAPDGSSFTTIYSFASSDGANPYAPLIYSTDGNLYGTTAQGGGDGFGTVFKVSPDGGTFATIFSFSLTDGGYPYAGVVQGMNGGLYGTTTQGGTSNYGTIFTVNPEGDGFTTIRDFAFSDGAYPYGSLIQGSDGSLYGTTTQGGAGGNGTVFKLSTVKGGSPFTSIHSFMDSDGGYPYAGVVQGPGGYLYGTTSQGGTDENGTVFKVSADGSSFTTIHFFADSEGNNPYAGVIVGADGNLYGTTRLGGDNGYGTVFKVAPDGSTFTTIHSFGPSDGAYPFAPVVQGADGSLYGTTYQGGTGGLGTVFKLSPDGSTFATIRSFSGSDGRFPYGGLVFQNGLLYGTTSLGGTIGFGTVFEISPDGSTFQTVYTFSSDDGADPFSSLIVGSDAALYGTAYQGGDAGGGVVFRLVPQATRPTTLVVLPTSVTAGGIATISATLTSNGSPVAGETVSFTSVGGPWQDGTGFSATTGANGVATGTITSAAGDPGSYPGSMGATFAGDALYAPSSGSGDVVVTCGTVIAVASGSATISPGQSAPLTGSGGVSCSWTPATGLDNASSCTSTATPAATTTYSLVVTDAYGCASSNSATVTVTVQTPAGTTLSLSSSSNPSLTTAPTVFTAAVAPVPPATGQPTGAVEFFADGVSLGKSPVFLKNGSIVAVRGGAPLSIGVHSITAQYSGDSNFNPSSSSAIQETVNPGTYFAIDLGTLGGTNSAGLALNQAGQVTGWADTSGNAATHAFLYGGGPMMDLGTLGGTSSIGQAINGAGLVAGSANETNGSSHAFLYNGSTMVDVGTLGGASSFGEGINDSGQVTGPADTGTSSESHAFLYSGGIPMDLGTLGGTDSWGQAINDTGQVTGYASTTGDAATHAFLYSGGTMLDLGTLRSGSGGSSSHLNPSGTNSVGQAISDAGLVTGWSNTTGDTAKHAFVAIGGGIADLGTLGGTNSYGLAINDSAEVAGYGDMSGDASQHALLYNSGTMMDLGTLGGTNSQAQALNNLGQAAGRSNTSGDAAQHAFVYSGGAEIDLGTLGGTNSNGQAINDAGQVTGWADTTGDAAQHAVLWQPVSVSMLSVGFVTGQTGAVVSLSAKLTSFGIVEAGKTVNFTLNGSFVGAAATDSLGRVALPNVSLVGVAPGSYPAAIGASFGGDKTLGASTGSAELDVTCDTPAAVAAGSTSILSGQSTQLSGSGGVSCSWVPATGLDNATSCTPNAIPTSTTTYSLTVYDAYGCPSTNAATVTVIVLTSVPTATTLSSNRTTALTTSPPVFTATVVPTPVLSGITGQVEFFADGVSLGKSPVFLKNGSYVAVRGGATLSVGSHSITAQYLGDANFKPSGSSSAAQTINPGTYFAIDLGTLGGPSSLGLAINSVGQVTGWAERSDDFTVVPFLWSGGPMTDLGTLGGDSSIGQAINDSGQVTGYASTTGDAATHAFLSSGGPMMDLGSLGGINSYGQAINNSGQVAGFADTTGQTATHAFLYSGGTMMDLGTLGGLVSWGLAMNDSGQVTGWSQTNGNTARHAFLYSGGQMTDLGTFGGGYSAGQAINGAGQVTGTAYTSSNTGHAFLYTGVPLLDLGTFGGSYSSGQAINDAGQVTGEAETSGDVTYHAFLYDGGPLLDLGTLGRDNSFGNAINNAGQVTGASFNGGQNSTSYYAFVYGGGAMIALGALGGTQSVGAAINDAGQVTGWANTTGDAASHAVLWQPVPVSALAASPASGLAGRTVTLSATLTSLGSVSGKTIVFTLDGVAVGSAVTNGSGLATLMNVSLAGIAAGSYPGAITAGFSGDPTLGASTGTAELDVACAAPAAMASGSATILLGQSTPLSGSGGISCSWVPATGLDNATSCTPNASPSTTTTYTLTVYDVSGCPSTNNPTVTVTVTTVSADVQVTLSSSASSAAIGQTVLLTITAANGGPDDASGVQITDLLPAGLTFVADKTSTGTYNSGTGLWTIGALANGASVSLQIDATVNTTGAITDTATKTAETEFDPDTANDSASVSISGQPTADVGLAMTVDNSSPLVGQNVTFTLTTSNAGPSDADGVQVSDLVPAGLSFVSATPSPGTSYDPQTGFWTVGTIPHGTSATLQLVAIVGQTGPLTNTATKTAETEFDPNPANDSAAVTLNAQPIADIQVQVFVSTLTPLVGQNVNLRLLATNVGPNNATGVAVTDLLPAGLQFVSSIPSGSTSYNSTTGVWSIGALSTGPPATLQITAKVTQAGTIVDTATKTAEDETDPNPSNDSSSATLNGQPSADVQVTQSASSPAAPIGQNVSFTITATNLGPSTADGVQLTDLLPSSLTFVSAMQSQGTYNSGSGLWDLGMLAPNGSATLQITATVGQTGSITNTATKTAETETDPNTANDSASVTITGQASADIGLTMTSNKPNPAVGTNVTFTIKASDGGPSNATGVQVTDLLPAGLSFVSATPTQGTYASGTGVWSVGAVNNGATATLTLVAKVTASGTIINTATKTAENEADLNPINDTASVTLNKTATTTTLASSVNPSTFGQSVTFTATVAPAAATGTVTFKKGATILGTASVSGGTAQFMISTLAVGTSSITAAYGGDSTDAPSTSATVSQKVNKAATTTALAALPAAPYTYGQAITFTATVTSTGGVPGGTVTFKNGGASIGKGTLVGGVATLTPPPLAGGAHSVTAVYSGDPSFATSTSPVLSLTIGAVGTTTTLVSSQNPSVYKQPVTFTATVTAPGQSPTGNVKFMDGGATLKTVMLSGGTASFTTTTPLAVASHTITAVYVGNANFAASTSPAVTQVVNPAPTATALMSSPNPSTAGQSVALTATVTSAFATPNGSVTFKDGTATLGSKNLSASGTTTLNVPLAHGSHSLTAVYAGNGNFTGSTSVPVTQVVN